MIDTFDLTKKIVSLSKGNIDMLKLQKLCYYSQAWYCAFNNDPLIDDNFEALENGPDCRKIRTLYPTVGSEALKVDTFENDYILSDTDADHHVTEIFNLYGNFPGEMLSEFSHRESPWINARNLSALDAKDESSIIQLDDMRDCYSKHSFYDFLWGKLHKDYSYKKYIIENDKPFIIEMDTEERAIIKSIVTRPDFLSKKASDRLYTTDHNGQMYEFFIADNNILLLARSVKEYIMNQIKMKKDLTMKIKESFKRKELSYFWQYNDEPGEDHFYAYASPELGIMVNEKTLDDAIECAVEMLEFLKESYDKAEVSSQDEQEKAMINRVYSLYKIDRNEFYNLLGLNISAQLQGEKLNGN